MERWKSIGILLTVLLLGGSVFAGSITAQSAGKNNKPLKVPINPVKLESGQIITPLGIYNVTKIYKTPNGVTHMEGKHVSKVQPPAISDKPLKVSINPVKLESGQIIIPVLAVSAQKENHITPPMNEINLTGQSVVFFNVANLTPIENKSRLILQGTKTPTGCHYNISLHKNNTEGNITEVLRELAVNPTTCQQLVEQGTLSKPLSYKTDGTEFQNKIVFVNKTAKTTTVDSTAQATFKTTWYDPINIVVNYVSDTVNWNYDGTTVVPNFWSDARWPNSLTGWYEVAHTFYPYYDSTHVRASTYDHMENDLFCALQTTNVWYQLNNVTGYANGASDGVVVSWDDGGCSTLLHYEITLS